MEEFRFTNEVPTSRTDEVIDYLTGPRLWIPHHDYPDILDWAQKAHAELRSGTKRAMVAFYGGEIAGVTVYQRHKQELTILEVKNITVRPDLRGRHVASFLLRNAEIEGAREFEADYVVCDSKAGNIGIRLFLLREHYQVIDQTDLYGLGAGEDVVFRKPLFPHDIPL